MTGEAESKSFLENATKDLWATVSRSELQLLLADDQAWKNFVAEAHLSRDEADVLHEALNKLKKDMLQKDLLDRDRFLKEFPRVKMELEERIGKLHALADKVDKTHKDCTISSVVATSTSTVSGILTILGLTLTPVIAGASLVLLGVGVGLGAAATVTSVSTSIVDHTSKSLAKAKARNLVSTSFDQVEVIAEALRDFIPKIVSCTGKCSQAREIIGDIIGASELAKANPCLVDSATRLTTTGSTSVRRCQQVQKAFAGTALAMTKGARIMGVATAGFCLLKDVASLVKESKHLHEGAKTESAEELRQEAQKLERKLEELTRIHGSLQYLSQ